MKKKLLFLIFTLCCAVIFASCKNGFVFVKGTSFTGKIADSEIFIEGRTVKINNFFICICKSFLLKLTFYIVKYHNFVLLLIIL